MTETIDISKLDKAAVLAALYNGARPMGMGVYQARDGVMTVEEAREIMATGSTQDYGPTRPQTTYFDYLFGRPLKINLERDTLRIDLYERDHGKGSAIRALQRAGLIDKAA